MFKYLAVVSQIIVSGLNDHIYQGILNQKLSVPGGYDDIHLLYGQYDILDVTPEDSGLSLKVVGLEHLVQLR